MRRLVSSSACAPRVRVCRERGYTIVELLTATVLTLMLMGVVVTVFGALGRSINDSRATLEMTGRLRAVKAILQLDLEGLTVPVFPPRRPEAGEGYLEIIEGPFGSIYPNHMVATPSRSPPRSIEMFAVDSDTWQRDTTVIDSDDVLMFTTRSRAGPFVGRFGDDTIESHEAEIAWFVRGRTLYRRVLLIAPQTMRPDDGNWGRMRYLDNNYDTAADLTDDNGVVDTIDLAASSFHAWYDLSARPETNVFGVAGWVPNTLGDLTKRENRFAHCLHRTGDIFPFNAGRWNQLGLPTLHECSDPAWMTWPDLSDFTLVKPVPRWDPAGVPSPPPPLLPLPPQPPIDFWNNPHPWSGVDSVNGTLLAYNSGPRYAEDVILTNVIGFDVKVWDPDAPVLRAVYDNPAGGTPTPLNLLDDEPRDGVLVTQGDPGYPLSLAHLLQEWATPPGSSSLPVGGRGTYVDLGYAAYSMNTWLVPWNDDLGLFAGLGVNVFRTYDTWSFHYEHDGIDQDGSLGADQGTNGFDDNGDGIVDDVLEMEAGPPYPAPLRGIQVKIRTFEPDSRQVREVTVIADFSPK